jgi:hypothetical protein
MKHFTSIRSPAVTEIRRLREGLQPRTAFIASMCKFVVCVLFHRRHYRHHMVGHFDCECQCEKCGRIWMVN